MMRDPTDLRGLEQDQEELDRREAAARRLEEDDFRWLMSQKQGRRLVHQLLAETGVYRSSFTGNSETFFREGARSVGLRYLGLINAVCPEQYTIMLQEQKRGR